MHLKLWTTNNIPDMIEKGLISYEVSNSFDIFELTYDITKDSCALNLGF